MQNRKLVHFKPLPFLYKPLQQIRNQGIIEPLPSQLEEVYTSYLSVLEEGKLYIVQGE